MKRIVLFLGAIITVLSYWVSNVVSVVKALARFTKKAPGQILAPIGVLTCSVLGLTIADGTIFDGPLLGLQAVLIFIQFRSLRRTIKADRIRKLKEDKERLVEFFGANIAFRPNPGLVRFLPIYKDPWLRAWYYKLRGITRLSLYRYGANDDVGSHTKFQVNAKSLFHLQLKGCIDTEDPDSAVEGINFVAENYLTK